MEKYKEIKSIMETSEKLINYRKIFYEETKDLNCDKKGCGFNLSNKFSEFEVTLSFDSWKGYYGNSSCSRIFLFGNQELIKKAFYQYLKINESKIMNFLGEYLKNEAIDLKNEAMSEANAALDFLNKIESIEYEIEVSDAKND